MVKGRLEINNIEIKIILNLNYLQFMSIIFYNFL
jgi:hypothetical protein